MKIDHQQATLRLAALATYDILDTGADAEFDALTKLAAYIAGTPVALITLLDEDRLWFKSKIGSSLSEVSYDQAFCRYTIQSDQALEIRNTQLDERFADNPLVTGPGHVRYYCGLPLITPEGIRLGSLCVIDHEAKQLSPEQLEALKTLASEVTARLELRRQKKVIEQQRQQLQEANQHLEEKVQQRTQELLDANAMLAQAKAELDTFLYRASHDLKGPLSSLQGLLQLMQMDAQACTQTLYWAHMQDSIHKLDGVLTGLLNYTDDTHTPLFYQQIDFYQLVDQALQNVKDEKGYANIVVKSYLHVPVPFFSDRERLGIMLTNLLKNGIVFQSNRVAQPEVAIWIECSFQEVILIVRDNGIGIATEQLDKVYHRFAKYSNQSVGAGLGLFVIQEIVQKLQGTVHLQSQLGKGTTVTVKLPNALAG